MNGLDIVSWSIVGDLAERAVVLVQCIAISFLLRILSWAGSENNEEEDREDERIATSLLLLQILAAAMAENNEEEDREDERIYVRHLTVEANHSKPL